LRRRGATVFLAGNPEEAIWFAERVAPDVLVIDEGLAEKVVPALRSRNPEARIVMLVGEPPRAATGPSAEGAASQRVPKPADGASVLAYIAAALGPRLVPVEGAPRRSSMVLCVDDDLLHLRSMERLLSWHGYRVATFDDPEAALEAMQGAVPDLAILDVRMPSMNGLNLVEEVQDSFGGRVPVVVYSALNGDREMADGYRRGARFYLTKPCGPQKVLDVVDYLIGDLDDTERKLLSASI
jgi:DNA-binding response OmpR family regulator